MAKKLLSIDIGVMTTKVVEMDSQARKPKIYKCAEFPTPQGAVVDGYVVLDKLEPLRESIKTGLKANKIRCKNVLFTVFSGKIITREVVLPGVKEHQINALIQTNATEYFPIELDDYKITNTKIETFREGENAGKHKVLVIAAEKKLIEGYEKLAEALNLNIIDIDYAGNSIFQSVRNSAGAGAVLTAKVEDESTFITIVRQGTLVLQRTINYNVGAQVEDDKIGIAEASRTIVGTVMRLIDFFMSSANSTNIERIYVVGEGAKHQSFVKLLGDETQIDCYPLDAIRGVTLTKKVAMAPMSIFATAIGAGINSVGFDDEKEKERHETNYIAASILMIILIGVVAVAMLTFALIPYSAALIEQDSLEAKEAQLEPARVVYEQYNGMMDLIAKVRYGQALTHNSNDAILDFLEELEKMLPADVEVSDFSSDDTQCEISMRVADKETAAGIIKQFREFESISNVTVTGITEETADNEADDNLSSDTKIINFTLTALYNVQTPVEPTTTSTSDETSDTSSDDVTE
jgi:type IV pilus assembly protein PilM